MPKKLTIFTQTPDGLHDIPGFEGLYAVNEFNQVWSYPKINAKNGKVLTKGRWRKTFFNNNKDKIEFVQLVKGGKSYSLTLKNILSPVSDASKLSRASNKPSEPKKPPASKETPPQTPAPNEPSEPWTPHEKALRYACNDSVYYDADDYYDADENYFVINERLNALLAKIEMETRKIERSKLERRRDIFSHWLHDGADANLIEPLKESLNCNLGYALPPDMISRFRQVLSSANKTPAHNTTTSATASPVVEADNGDENDDDDGDDDDDEEPWTPYEKALQKRTQEQESDYTNELYTKNLEKVKNSEMRNMTESWHEDYARQETIVQNESRACIRAYFSLKEMLRFEEITEFTKNETGSLEPIYAYIEIIYPNNFIGYSVVFPPRFPVAGASFTTLIEALAYAESKTGVSRDNIKLSGRLGSAGENNEVKWTPFRDLKFLFDENLKYVKLCAKNP